MKGYKRTDRLGELLREEIADLIVSGSVKTLNLGFVTITRVRVSADLSYADVYFSVLDGSWDSTKKQLEENRGALQVAIGKDLRLKKMPRLRFKEDRSLEHVQRIENLLERIKGEGEGGKDSE